MRDKMEKKHSRETYYERREVAADRKTFSESSQYYRSVIKKGHCKEIIEEQRYRKEKIKSSSDYSSKNREGNKRHISPEPNRRERTHRNSPVELVVSGCRNTDSSSSSPESVDENIRQKHRRRKHKKRHDSFEELSRRKQRIESELSALDAEEAAQKQTFEPRMRRNYSHDRHERVDAIPAKRIKHEPVSDDENDRRERRGNHRSSDRPGRKRKNGINESRNAADNSEWGNVDSSRSKIPDKEKEKPNFSVSVTSESRPQSLQTPFN